MTIDAYTGSTVTLDATFTNEPGGSVVDPTSVSLSVLDSDGNVDFGPYTYAGGTITKVTTGYYRKQLAIPAGTTVGAYTVAWTAVIDGDTRLGYETLNLSEASADPTTVTDLPWYCTREEVAQALDTIATSRTNRQIDRAIEAATGTIDSLCHRSFAPVYATRTFDWPNTNSGTPWRLWLDGHDLISVVTLTSGGVAIAADDFLLRPDAGPPYTHIEIDISTASAFSTGSTHQRAISILGLWGYRNDETNLGTTVEALDDDETGVDVSDSSVVGVGSILRIDSERVIVTGKAQADTGQNLQTSLTAAASGTTVAVSDGTGFAVGEVILIESEKMLVTDISVNNLIVRRAWDGTTLAAHSSSADIYAPRSLTVRRGALGTTAASHSSGAAIYQWRPPGLVRSLAVAEALATVGQEQAGYARTVGTGENQQEATGKGIAGLRDQVWTAHGRKARHRAV